MSEGAERRRGRRFESCHSDQKSLGFSDLGRRSGRPLACRRFPKRPARAPRTHRAV